MEDMANKEIRKFQIKRNPKDLGNVLITRKQIDYVPIIILIAIKFL